MKRIYVQLIILCFSISSGFAQNSWITYNTSNSGLSEDNIWAIGVDANNKKFFGINGGNSCVLDGATWTTFDLPSSNINSNYCSDITFDSANKLWLVTMDAVWKKNDTGWVQYPLGTPAGCMFDTLGRLWVATGNGIRKFDGVNWTSYTTSNSGLAGNSVNCVYVDKNNNIWAGTYFNGLSKYDGSAWTTYTTASGLPHNRVQTITQDNDGNIWVGCYNGGAAKFNGSTWTIYSSANSGLAANRVNYMTVDHSGSIWFAFGNVGWGVSKFDGTNWTTYNPSNSGLAYSQVNTIGVDNDNRIWFGTNGSGVSVFDNGSTPLAIGLTSFTASINIRHQAVLKWCIDNTEGIDHFEVERSDDGIHFTSEGMVGILLQEKCYQFTDINALEKSAYYRIKVSFGNVGCKYSNIIHLNSDVHITDLEMYPNPAKNTINVTVARNEEAILTTGGGRLIRKIELHRGINVLDINDLPSGIYFINLSTKSVKFFKE